MARASREQAAQHRADVVDAASRLFRDRGLREVGLSEVMTEVGLTQGGFYKQFASKQALAAEATSRAFELKNADLDWVAAQHPDDPSAAMRDLVASYLSPGSRDDRADGCAATALSGDATHDEPDGSVRAAYTRGLDGFVAALSSFTESDDDRAERIATVCTLVGALTLSRAAAGSPLSDEILAAVRDHLSPHQTKP
ncbi:MAG TPA: TetR family transcriptional regulator [Pseudonocardiaceae bacterium]|jgi:TetR/AcrR family transcriptional repressor of nem operon|nr:TetR family transcriptional regulator [Pseudonocardiaceae bacterium]